MTYITPQKSISYVTPDAVKYASISPLASILRQRASSCGGGLDFFPLFRSGGKFARSWSNFQSKFEKTKQEPLAPPNSVDVY